MFQKYFSKILVFSIIFGFALSADAQKRKPKKPGKKAAVSNTEVPKEEPDNSEKKNTRPEVVAEPSETPIPGKKNSKSEQTANSTTAVKSKANPVYFYEFSRAEFSISKILIAHDENGKGTISFLKKYFDEELSDPLDLSAATVEKIKMIWQNLNFLDSAENYQYEKDYPHLGQQKFTMKKDGRERTAEFNWTTNPDAKALADEYRKIGNQHIWMFDINVSRENQPLESARIMDALDSQIKRNEISDPEQMIPFLKELSNDERIPLVSRNHASRLVNEIEKRIAKKKPEKN